VTILRPAGSDASPYDVQFLNFHASATNVSSTPGEIKNCVTTLQMTMDLRSVAPSAYQLALRRAAMTRAYFRRLSSSVTSVRKSGAVCYATWVAAPCTTHIGWPDGDLQMQDGGLT